VPISSYPWELQCYFLGLEWNRENGKVSSPSGSVFLIRLQSVWLARVGAVHAEIMKTMSRSNTNGRGIVDQTAVGGRGCHACHIAAPDCCRTTVRDSLPGRNGAQCMADASSNVGRSWHTSYLRDAASAMFTSCNTPSGFEQQSRGSSSANTRLIDYRQKTPATCMTESASTTTQVSNPSSTVPNFHFCRFPLLFFHQGRPPLKP
jgi:hypothetical protein